MTLNVLIACEESGAVRDAFRALGHNAWSCDLQPCDPASPFSAYHVQGDAVEVISSPWKFQQIPTQMGRWWDLVIAHPPCTYLCNSGVTWLFKNIVESMVHDASICKPNTTLLFKKCKDPNRVFAIPANGERVAKMREGGNLFRRIWESVEKDGIPHLAIENPVMHQYAVGHIGVGKQQQVIQPWMFGHSESKATCLWLRNLPKLVETNNVKALRDSLPAQQRQRLHYLPPSKDRAKLRSRTFKGIALAMAQQWSEYILNEQANRTLASMYAAPSVRALGRTAKVQVPLRGVGKP